MKNESLIKTYLASNALFGIAQDIEKYDSHISTILISCANILAKDLKTTVEKAEQETPVAEPVRECQCHKEDVQDKEKSAIKEGDVVEPSEDCPTHCMCHSQSDEPESYSQREENGPSVIDSATVDDKIKTIVSEIKSELNL